MSYQGTHVKIRKVRGSARKHACIKCGKSALEWAYRHGSPDELQDAQGRRYSRDIFSYDPMCKHCHQVYDKSFITACPNGHEYTPDNTLIDAGKRKCKVCVYARNNARRRANPMTVEAKARKLELQRQRRARERAA